MQVTLPLGGGVVERDIPQRTTGLAIGEALPDGERLVLDVTESGAPVEAWLYLGNRSTGVRLFEGTSATGDFTLSDDDLDAVCPPGSSIGYEVWTEVGTSAERIRYYGSIRRARSLSNATPAPALASPQTVSFEYNETPATYDLSQHLTGGIAPIAWAQVQNDQPAKLVLNGSTLEITQTGYTATFVASATDAFARTAQITVQVNVGAVPVWLLSTGSWNDAGTWDDTATWTEAA